MRASLRTLCFKHRYELMHLLLSMDKLNILLVLSFDSEFWNFVSG